MFKLINVLLPWQLQSRLRHVCEKWGKVLMTVGVAVIVVMGDYGVFEVNQQQIGGGTVRTQIIHKHTLVLPTIFTNSIWFELTSILMLFLHSDCVIIYSWDLLYTEKSHKQSNKGFNEAARFFFFLYYIFYESPCNDNSENRTPAI